MAPKRFDHVTRQHHIAAAARDIITTGGLGALTINELAARVGVTEAALYRHVHSKDEILLLLVRDIRESLFEAISSVARSDRRSLEKLEHLLQLHLSYVEQRGGISFVIIAEALRFGAARVKTAARELVERYLDLVESILVDGVRAGEVNREIDARAAAIMFFGMVQASVTRWQFDEATHPLGEKAADMWRIFRRALQADGSTREAPARLRPLHSR